MNNKLPAIHVGELIREDLLEPYGLSVARAAELLGVRRATLSVILNERGGVSPEMAMRLEKAFGVNAEFLLRWQAAYDAKIARDQYAGLKIARYEPKAA